MQVRNRASYVQDLIKAQDLTDCPSTSTTPPSSC